MPTRAILACPVCGADLPDPAKCPACRETFDEDGGTPVLMSPRPPSWAHPDAPERGAYR